MTDEQPEALRLADDLDAEFVQGRISNHSGRKAAVMLRRLHAENEALRQSLRIEELISFRRQMQTYAAQVEADTALLRQALEALESCTPGDYSTGHVISPSYDESNVEAAITAIKDALAEQPAQQQEPVAWLHNGKLHEVDPIDWATGTVTPLYPSAQFSKPWVGLTDEEIEQVCVPLGAAMLSFTEVARAIEAKLKEKNA